MNQPLIGIADAHLLDKSRADHSSPKGLVWATSTSLSVYKPVAVAWLGDMLDGAAAPLDVIVEAHKDTLREIDSLLAFHNVPLWYAKGNHENAPIERVRDVLRSVMHHSTIAAFEDDEIVEWYGWRLLHGHQLDPWCHGPQNILSELGTAFGSVIERIIPGFEKEWLNPTGWDNPPRCDSNAWQMLLPEAADAYAVKIGKRVLHGHTHRRRITKDRRVVCAGTCTHGRGEFVAVWPNGDVVLHEMLKEAA